MNFAHVPHLVREFIPWWFSGAMTGLLLVPLIRIIPRKVLQSAKVPLYEWEGPGGGLKQPVTHIRYIWVPVLNASLWCFAAANNSLPYFWAALPDACLASMLLLLALIDWDTTLLPDRIVLPLGAAGLVLSYYGFTPQNLFESVISVVLVLGLLTGLALLFLRIKDMSGIGGGDIKLLAALAAWWGTVDVLYVILWSSVITTVWYLLWRRFKGLGPEDEWPFGPAIVLAALAWGLS